MYSISKCYSQKHQITPCKETCFLNSSPYIISEFFSSPNFNLMGCESKNMFFLFAFGCRKKFLMYNREYNGEGLEQKNDKR